MSIREHGGLREHIEQIRLVDHHVHGSFDAVATGGAITREVFENALNEASTVPVPAWDSAFDTQLGFAVRAHCAPLLGLERHASPDDYWRARSALGEDEVTRRLAGAAGVDSWLVDEGFTLGVVSRQRLAELAGGDSREIVRLEQVAEDAVAAGGSYVAAYEELLRERLSCDEVVGCKSIIAYRTGFDVDWSAVPDAEVDQRAAEWRDAGGTRLDDARLLVHGIRVALAVGKPLQLHVGFGDRDERLHETNPMLLTDLLREHPDAPLALLHCYPYEREAGYLAQAFAGVHIDVGLAVNHLGARSASLIARSLELAPLRRVLYSSDAYGPAELHMLGARLWRDGTASALERFVADDTWSEADARRVATLIGAGNAERLYQL